MMNKFKNAFKRTKRTSLPMTELENELSQPIMVEMVKGSAKAPSFSFMNKLPANDGLHL